MNKQAPVRGLAFYMEWVSFYHSCGCGGVGPSGDGRCHRPSADEEDVRLPDPGLRLCPLLRGPHRRCLPHRRLRLPLDCRQYAGQGRSHRRSDRGSGCRASKKVTIIVCIAEICGQVKKSLRCNDFFDLYSGDKITSYGSLREPISA